jgi:hypothetical protein
VPATTKTRRPSSLQRHPASCTPGATLQQGRGPMIREETVDLAAARSVLREIIALGDQAPGLTDEQSRFRLLTLAAYTAPKSPAPRSPIGRWSSDAPESAPSGRSAPPEVVQLTNLQRAEPAPHNPAWLLQRA